jgi:uncharacterized protein (DUF885 family)
MLRSLIMSLAVLAGAGFATASAQTPADAAFNALMAEYEAYDRDADPITAGFEGDREALRRMPDVSLAHQQAQARTLADLQRRIEAVDASQLSQEAALNRSFVLRLIGEGIESIQFDEARFIFYNDSGFYNDADYLAMTTPIQSRDDAEAWLARLAAVPLYYQQNLDNGRRAIATRFTQPRVVYNAALAAAQAQLALPVEESPLLTPFADLPAAIPAEAQADYRARALALIRDQIRPQQQAYIQFLQQEYEPALRPQLGVRSLPNGAAYYRYLVRYHTTTDMTPEQIHRLGVQEVARIRAEMETVIAETGFDGTFAEFLNFLRTDPQFYATTREDLLEKASEIAKRADDQLPRIFGLLPRLPYGVRPVPPEMEEGYTTARYWPGSPALGQAGGLIVNTSHLDQRPLYEFPALMLHEGVPGHHLQIALSQELEGIPSFRRNAVMTAYVEGWGLYSESLGEEMGMYTTPYERFGQLSMEMWRACRLVADTGIHWMGWSIERARQCFDENSALAPHNITTELERYVSWPGQALAYKIGELTIQRLRGEAQNTLGERFNVRAFHDVVLGAGPLPMDMLEARVHGWMEVQRSAAS